MFLRCLSCLYKNRYKSGSNWVRSQNCGCLVTWFCYQLIAKPGNKTASVSWLTQLLSVAEQDVRQWEKTLQWLKQCSATEIKWTHNYMYNAVELSSVTLGWDGLGFSWFFGDYIWYLRIFSCDQAALWMVFSVRLSVCPSVRLSVCLSVCHTFLTMLPSSYHHEIFRSYHIGPG